MQQEAPSAVLPQPDDMATVASPNDNDTTNETEVEATLLSLEETEIKHKTTENQEDIHDLLLEAPTPNEMTLSCQGTQEKEKEDSALSSTMTTTKSPKEAEAAIEVATILQSNNNNKDTETTPKTTGDVQYPTFTCSTNVDQSPRGQKRPLDSNDSTTRASSLYLRPRRPQGWEVQWSMEENKKKTAKVTLLEPQATISIAGRGSVCCRQGAVSGHGFVLKRNIWYAFECPQWSSWLVLETSSDTAMIEIQERAMGEPASSTTFNETNSEQAQPLHGPSLPPYWDSAQNTADDEEETEEKYYESFATFALYNTASPRSRPTWVLPEWRAVAQSIIQGRGPLKTTRGRRHNNSNIIAIVGAKGVGKSTFLRYLIHGFLSQGQSVRVLDGDTGQAEFGPPGLLTLTYVPDTSAPLWSLPHHHMVVNKVSSIWAPPSSALRHGKTNPLISPDSTQAGIFFGGTTSQLDPARYLQSMTRLIEIYHEQCNSEIQSTATTTNEKATIPLIINLDGWVKGLGYQILSTFLGTHQPNHVVQIVGTNATQQVDVSPAVKEFETVIHTLPSYLKSASSKISPALSVPSSAWRDLRFVHYFLDDPALEIGFSQNDLIRDDDQVIAQRLAAQCPYRVPWDMVSCQTVDGVGIAPHILNGRIVALCEDRVQPKMGNCVGLAIVRSVDVIKRLYYILTPVVPTILPKVRLLVLGKLSLPFECIFLGARGSSFPYQMDKSTTGDIIGAGPMQSRKNILRKGMNT